jgi:hypothetical protein
MLEAVKIAKVSLNGEVFSVRFGEPFACNSFTYYPVELEHDSSGLCYDGEPVEDIYPSVVATDNFCDDVWTFYCRIFGREPHEPAYAVLQPPQEPAKREPGTDVRLGGYCPHCGSPDRGYRRLVDSGGKPGMPAKIVCGDEWHK